MYGTISKTGNAQFFFIRGDDASNYYSQFGWVDASFRDKVEVGARVEFQIRDFQGKPQAFAVRAEAAPTLAITPEAKPFVRTPKADEHKDRRLILLNNLLKEGRMMMTEEEQKKLFAVWLTDAQGHLLTDSYRCSNCDGHERLYREKFDGLYAVTFGNDQPAVILCQRCRQRFYQLFSESKAEFKPLYGILERLGIRPNGRGWTLGQAASSHRREKIRRQTKPACKGSEKARQRNAATVERLSGGWRKIA